MSNYVPLYSLSGVATASDWVFVTLHTQRPSTHPIYVGNVSKELAWCNENVEGRWTLSSTQYAWVSFGFECPEVATMFQLIFGGGDD